MEGKIINKNVVPNKFYLCEEDVGGKSLIFSINAINDGVDVSLLTGYLDIIRSDETTDRLILTKTIGDNIVYFSTKVLNTLTLVGGFVDAQITFENEDKSIVYKTKKFIIEVEKSIDGYSSYDSTLPSVIVTVRDEVKKALDDCNDIKVHIDTAKNQIDNVSEHLLDNAVLSVNGKKGNVVLGYEDIGGILQESLATINGKSILNGGNIDIEGGNIEVDSELSLTSENAVKNKVVTEKLNTIPLVVDEIVELPTPHENIIVGYTNSIDLASLNYQPKEGDKFWGLFKSDDDYVYGAVAEITDEDFSDGFASFILTEVWLIHDASCIKNDDYAEVWESNGEEGKYGIVRPANGLLIDSRNNLTTNRTTTGVGTNNKIVWDKEKFLSEIKKGNSNTAVTVGTLEMAVKSALTNLASNQFTNYPIEWTKSEQKVIQDKLGIAIKSGNGNNSGQLPQEVSQFSYNGAVWSSPAFKTGATGKGAMLLSTKGRVDRNYFLNVGNRNVAEYNQDETPYEEQDDGGAVIGYKNYTNSRGSTLFGAWNRAIKAKCAFVGGYANTTTHTAGGNSASLNIGTNNYLFGNTQDSALIGSYLLGNEENSSQSHFGMYNKPEKDVIHSIGNGTAKAAYYEEISKDGYTLESVKAHNELHQYSPNREFNLYLKIDNDYTLIDENTRQQDFNSYGLYERKIGTRSNAFQVTVDGRAQLIQKEVDGVLIEKGDNDILVKKEILAEVKNAIDALNERLNAIEETIKNS